MSDRSGLELTEMAILTVLDGMTIARSARTFVTSAKVLTEIEKQIGLGPRYSYGMLLDLARPWTIPLRLVAFRGNWGDPFFPAAGAWYTECRPSHVAQVVLKAERQQLAPIPVGLINGTIHRGGLRPPLSPFRVLRVVQDLIDDQQLTDADIRDMVGQPDFLTGCEVTGHLDALASGQPTVLRLAAQVAITDSRHLVIRSLPAGVSPTDLIDGINRRSSSRPWDDTFPRLQQATALPIEDIEDQSTGADVRIVVTLRLGADPETVREKLAEIDGIAIDVPLAFPGPLASIIRSWVEIYRNENISFSVSALEDAIKLDRQTEALH